MNPFDMVWVDRRNPFDAPDHEVPIGPELPKPSMVIVTGLVGPLRVLGRVLDQGGWIFTKGGRLVVHGAGSFGRRLVSRVDVPGPMWIRLDTKEPPEPVDPEGPDLCEHGMDGRPGWCRACLEAGDPIRFEGY